MLIKEVKFLFLVAGGTNGFRLISISKCSNSSMTTNDRLNTDFSQSVLVTLMRLVGLIKNSDVTQHREGTRTWTVTSH